MSEQELKLAKVKKSCHAAKLVSKFAAILSTICAVLSVIGAALIVMMKTQVNDGIAQNLDHVTMEDIQTHGILNFQFKIQGLIESGNYASALLAYCIFAAAVCIFTAILFMMITRVFRTIENSVSPFTPEVMKSVKNIFVITTITTGLFTGIVPTILVGLTLWSIYCIIDYGCVLQADVDDTV